MSFDSLALRTVISELNTKTVRGQIRHIEQINPLEIVLKISKNEENHYLLVSAHANHFRTHLIDRPPKSDQDKHFHFASVLIEHTMYGEISKIEQLGYDRIMKIWIEPSRSVLQKPPRILVGEFMGKHSNIILVNEGTGEIIESIKHVDHTMSRYRQVLPGLDYELPPQQDKIDPYEVREDMLKTVIEKSSKKSWNTLFQNIDGLSPTLAKEIVARAKSDEPRAIWSALNEVLEYFEPENQRPQVLVDNDKVIAPSVMRLCQFPNADSLQFDTFSKAVEYYYQRVIREEKENSERNALRQALEKQGQNIEEKLKAFSEKLEKAEDAEKYKLMGELLTANLYRVERGQSKVEVENYYDPELEKITIELDPAISPSANAQKYFKLYNKAKRGRKIINRLIAENSDLLKVISDYETKVQEAENISELKKIRKQLENQNWIKKKQKRKKDDSKEQSAFLKLTSPDGFQLYVGRNSKENDLIIRRIATKHDMWLHAKQIPGSHVLVRNPEKKPGIPMPTLLFAAKIAAYYSKAKHSTTVPVDYTWAKYVVKPSGSEPGFVTYTHEKTLFVKPAKPVRRHDKNFEK